ncbi:glycosyltransferase [Castellaniella sp.]|uniref:glycosyltransferase n=1 Tax=Castellaniella sp. TaxID=1955812 RepID=UPI002AFE7F3F|nr:glycosyltransferase [Castellaniella sp.]
MKVPQPLLFVSTSLGTGGAERMLVKIMTRIDRSRFEPCVVSLFDHGTMGAALADLGIEIVCLRMNSFWRMLAAPFRLAALIRRRRCTVIQGWMYHGSLLAWIGRWLAGSSAGLSFGIRHTLVDVSREHLNTRVVIWIVSRLARKADVCMFNSKLSLYSHLAYGYRAQRVEVIPNGFEIEAYIPNPVSGQHLRKVLGLKDHLVVGLVARFDPAKDHENFLQAAALVHRQLPQVRFVLVGPKITNENIQLQTWVQQLGLGDVVLLLGERSDIADLNNLFDVACLTSWMEAFPNVVGEAMACGTPCVVTDVGDVRDIVGEAGRVVPVHNAEALAAAILDLLIMPADFRQRLGVLARDRIVDNFDMVQITKAYMHHFDVLAGKTATGNTDCSGAPG